MNGLSWLIYIADVIGNLSGVLVMLAIVTGIGAVITLAGTFVCTIDSDAMQFRDRWTKMLRPFIFSFIAFAVLASVTPGKNTILMIAASETGEQIMQSEVGTEAGDLALDTLKLLRDKINDELSSDAEE